MHLSVWQLLTKFNYLYSTTDEACSTFSPHLRPEMAGLQDEGYSFEEKISVISKFSLSKDGDSTK